MAIIGVFGTGLLIGVFGTGLLLGPGGFLSFGLSLVGQLVVVGIFMVVSFALWWRFDGWLVVAPVGSHCPQCGYNLAGIVSGRCPECGTETESEGPKA